MSTVSYFWYGTKPEVTFEPDTIEELENFESFPTVNQFFTVVNPSSMSGTTKGWEATTTYSLDGVQSIKNEAMPSVPATHQFARVDFKIMIPPYAKNIKISYYYYQDCEEDFDGLKVYLDGTLIHDYTSSGVYGGWSYGQITPSTTGEKILTFEYFKDGASDGGETDSVYIDSLQVEYDVDSIVEVPGTELVRFDSSGPYRLMYHRVGSDAPPITFIEQRIPFQPGSIYIHTDIQPREIEFGVLIEGENPADLREKIRNLTSKLINIDGVLYARYSDGTERRLFCRYKEGLEGEQTTKTGTGFYQKIVLVFRAFDPFWYEVLRISSQSTQNFVSSLVNDGAWPAYPVIYVDGPSSNTDVAIWLGGENEPGEGTETRLKINTTIPAGRKLLIDTKKRTVKLDDGTNLYMYIDNVANTFPSIPNDSTRYTLDADIEGAEANGRYHVYILKPHWGV